MQHVGTIPGRKIGVQVARVFRSGYFNGVIMYVCFTTSDRSLLDYTCNPYPAYTGAPDASDEFDPAWGPFDIFNHEIITSVLPVLLRPVLYLPHHEPHILYHGQFLLANQTFDKEKRLVIKYLLTQKLG